MVYSMAWLLKGCIFYYLVHEHAPILAKYGDPNYLLQFTRDLALLHSAANDYFLQNQKKS
jgi:hypothetical protein